MTNIDNIIDAAERLAAEEEKTDITEDEGWLRHQERMQTDDPANEKRRRVYYQDIVYAVCNRLDKVAFGTTVCGSWAEPSTNVQDRLDDAIQRWSDARDRIESLEAEMKELQDGAEKMLNNEDCGGDGWWDGWKAIKSTIIRKHLLTPAPTDDKGQT